MLKNQVLDVVGDLQQQALAGLPVDALAVAHRLALACLSEQESQIHNYLQLRGRGMETAQVAADFGISIQQAHTVLTQLLRLGVVSRGYAARESRGRPRSVWSVVTA